MERGNIVDDILSPVSKWVNRELFNEKQGRSVCQRIEDNTGVPKIVLEVGFGVLGMIALKKWLDSRK